MSRPDPIPVSLLRFNGSQDGPGFSVQTSIRPVPESNRNRRTIEYHPWVRAFWVEHQPMSGKVEGAYIPETRVHYWVPADVPADVAKPAVVAKEQRR